MRSDTSIVKFERCLVPFFGFKSKKDLIRSDQFVKLRCLDIIYATLYLLLFFPLFLLNVVSTLAQKFDYFSIFESHPSQSDPIVSIFAVNCPLKKFFYLELNPVLEALRFCANDDFFVSLFTVPCFHVINNEVFVKCLLNMHDYSVVVSCDSLDVPLDEADLGDFTDIVYVERDD